MYQGSPIHRFILTLFVITVSVVLVSCSTIDWLVNEGKEQQTSLRRESYTINTATILQSLKQGQAGVFKLQKTPSNVNPTPSIERVKWKQSDFLFVAPSFFEFAFQEPIIKWMLRSIEFNLNCNDVSSGPQAASLVFFKENQTKNRNSRISRTLYILADENRIMLSETEFYPEVDRWSAIDLSKDISLEAALIIAEKNDGATFRQEVNNNCTIKAENNADSGQDVWLVTYSVISNDQSKSLSLSINAQTGEYEKIR